MRKVGTGFPDERWRNGSAIARRFEAADIKIEAFCTNLLDSPRKSGIWHRPIPPGVAMLVLAAFELRILGLRPGNDVSTRVDGKRFDLFGETPLFLKFVRSGAAKAAFFPLFLFLFSSFLRYRLDFCPLFVFVEWSLRAH